MEIAITLSDTLVNVLEENGVKPQDYKPAYGGESVGLDLYYAGDKPFEVNTVDKILIPTGVRMALPQGYVAFVKDRGSITKTGYVRRAGVIDPGYTGEVFVNLLGMGTIQPGEKLPAQLVVVKAETNFVVVDKESFEVLTSASKRQEGKTGSSD